MIRSRKHFEKLILLTSVIWLVTLPPTKSWSTNISVIIRQCEDSPECYEKTDIDQSSVQYYRSLVKLLSSGMGQLVWEHVGRAEGLNVSSQCDESLQHVWSSIKQGEEWAFKMIDTAGKLSPSLLESTVTSFGSYDGCLETESKDGRGIAGKYCMVDVFAIGEQNDRYQHDREKVYLKSLPLFQGIPFFWSICVPSSCTSDDVRLIGKSALSNYPLRLSGEVTCDTKETNSYKYKMDNIDTSKLISLIFLSTFICSILACTVLSSLTNASKECLFYKVSISETIRKLLHFDENTMRTSGVDALRVMFVILGSVSHNLVCAEVPLGLFVSDKHSVFNAVFSSPGTQFFFNEAGLSGMTLLSGFATLYYGLPIAKKGKFPIMAAIIDRYFSYMPAIMCITAIDILWPFTGSGPMFSRVATFIGNKCSKNWWWNIFLIQNWLHPLDICVAQTYISAIVVQLFVASIPLLFLYASNRKSSNIFVAWLVAAAYVYQGYTCMIHKVTPSLFVSGNPSGPKTVSYFEWTHMHISAYLPSFFIGFLLADYISNSFKPVGGKKNNQHLFYIGLVLNLIATGSTAVYNSWQLLPDSMIPVFIVVVRMIFHASTSLSILYIFSEEVSKDESSSIQAEKSNKSTFWYRVNRILAQLSVGYYLGNYFYIRTEFFTTRQLWVNSVYVICKRTVIGFTMMTIMALFLHIFFVAPLDAMRKHILHPKREPIKKKE